MCYLIFSCLFFLAFVAVLNGKYEKAPILVYNKAKRSVSRLFMKMNMNKIN